MRMPLPLFISLAIILIMPMWRAFAETSEMIAFYLEVKKPQEASKGFEIIDIGTGLLQRGFYQKEPLLDISQIQLIRVTAREFNMKPAIGVGISFKKIAKAKAKAIEDDSSVVIYFYGAFRAKIPGKLLKAMLANSEELFVALPKKEMTTTEIDTLESKLEIMFEKN